MSNKTLTNQKLRIGKKSLAALPAKVSAEINRIKEDYNIASFNLLTVAEGFTLYPGEGEEYTVIVGDNQKNVKMFNQESVGALNVCYSLQGHPVMPVGAWVIILTGWYMGKRSLSVYNVVNDQIN